jgi:D-alanine-D-alanine ligase-like ATP-grasp enzyme
MEAALAAHRALPERGIVGTDIMLSNRGPVVGEVNSNPFHSVYQTAHARGFLNADILPKLKAVRARFAGSVPLPKDCPLK